jgi:hypothetical protein
MNNPHSTLRSGKIFCDSIRHSERPTLSSIIGFVIEELSSKSSSPALTVGDLDVTAGLTQLSNSDNLSVSTVQTLTAVLLDGQCSADNGSGSQASAIEYQMGISGKAKGSISEDSFPQIHSLSGLR